MPATKSKPRITVEVSEGQYNALKRHLEHGMQRRVFSIIIDDVVRMLDEYGQHFIIALMQKEVSYRSFMERYSEKNELEKSA